MNYFCTLFNKNYFSRGLSLYFSLDKVLKDYKLFILTIDDFSFNSLKKLALENIILIPLHEFEDPELIQAKKNRTLGEYCWTCTPSLIKYCLEKYALPICTYLDADLYFFGNPNILINEMGDKSVLITPHNYTPGYDQTKRSGKYCVQFLTFRHDEKGIKVLNWWREKCLEWCFAYYHDGKFGDQKYLDDWTDRFEGVHVLQHKGSFAPWNIQQFNLFPLVEKKTGLKVEPIFFHFHDLRIFSNWTIDYGAYYLEENVLNFFYRPYLDSLKSVESLTQDTLEIHGFYRKTRGFKSFLRAIRRRKTFFKLKEFFWIKR